MSTIAARATLDDLMRTEGRAELINGEVVQLMASGSRPSRIASRLGILLEFYSEKVGTGWPFSDGVGYAVAELSSGRESFQPDASWFSGSLPDNDMRFIDGAPTFAVEVRSENDYGPAAELEMSDKRGDYFEAGTVVVWDVDPMAKLIRKYTSGSIDCPQIFTIGETADAEPALPGWRVTVESVLRIKPGGLSKP